MKSIKLLVLELNNYNFRILILLIFCYIISTDVTAQNEQKLTKKEIREKKRAAKEAERLERYRAQIVSDENSLDEGDRIIYIRYNQQETEILKQLSNRLEEKGFPTSNHTQRNWSSFFITQARRLRDTKVKISATQEVGPDYPQYGFIFVNAHQENYPGFENSLEVEDGKRLSVRTFKPEIPAKEKRYEN